MVAYQVVQCMMVGYPGDHYMDCYRMMDPKTWRVHTTQDIIWLKLMFHMKPETNDDFTIEPLELNNNVRGQAIKVEEGNNESKDDNEMQPDDGNKTVVDNDDVTYDKAITMTAVANNDDDISDDVTTKTISWWMT